MSPKQRRASTFATGLALLLAACACPRAGGAELQVLTTPEHEALGLPFSEAVRVGDVIYVSGQIGSLPGSLALAPGGIEAETQQALANVAAILARNGSSLSRVARCSVFLLDMSEWPLMNEVWVRSFGAHRPARSAFAASGLAKGARVEIECLAAAGPGPEPGTLVQ